MPQTDPTQGYITAGANHPRHVEMAVDLCLSLKEHDPRRHFAVVIDSSLERHAARYSGVFDHLFVVPDELNFGHAAKLYVGQVSPFDRTLFIDADCLALGSVDELWGHLATRDFCVPGEYVGADETRHHHNFPIADLCRRFQLPRYYWASSPLFFFAEAGRPVLAECLRMYREVLPSEGIVRWDTGWPPDEIAFGVVGGRRSYEPFPPVQTLIKQPDLPRWVTGRPPHPVYHCTMSPALPVLSDLMRQVAARRRARGLPQGSRRFWVRKALYKKAQRGITRALGLPWKNPLRR